MAGVKVDSGPHAAFTGSKRLQLNTQVKVKGGGGEGEGAGVGSRLKTKETRPAVAHVRFLCWPIT